MGKRVLLKRALVGLTLILFAPQLAASETAASGTVYKSEIDELLTTESVSVLPFSDNLQGIYARPLENHFSELLGKMHRWDLVPLNSVGPVLSPEDLEEDQEKAKLMAGGISANAFFAARISKGPNGISIVLSLFLTKDAKLLAKATLKDGKRFEIADLKKELEGLLNKVVAQIPYQGRVLSRDGQRVTVNIGRLDGIQAGQILSVVQIVGVTRHPKFNFIISSEKEIIGRIKVLKVDDTLCFGTLISEKERGVVRKNSKIAGLDFVTYSDPGTFSDTSGASDLEERPDSKLSFGNNPSSWLPKHMPTFGQVGARIGNTLYNAAMNIPSVDALHGSTFFGPNVTLEGEIWVTPEFTVHAGMKQGIMPMKNPRDGSSPSKLNQQLSEYELLLGYNFRFASTVWGPSVELLFGYLNYRMYVDSSTPEGLTTMTYTGFKTGVRGQIPVTADLVWGAGAEMFMVFKASLSESPVSSGGDSNNTINMFGVFGYRKLTENLKLLMKLDLEQYSTTFSGRGSRAESANSSSQRHTTLSGGIYYMF